MSGRADSAADDYKTGTLGRQGNNKLCRIGGGATTVWLARKHSFVTKPV